MKESVAHVLVKLGFSPEDYANEPECELLEELLANVGPENILTSEEVGMLAEADMLGCGDDYVLKTLKSNGFEEDVLDVDESDIAYVQSKLMYFESDCWGSEIDSLCKLKDRMQKSLQDLKEKCDDALFERCTKECENEWGQISLTFDLLFQDLQQLEFMTENSGNAQAFSKFVNEYKTEVDRFVDLANKYIVKNVRAHEVNFNANEEFKEEHGITENTVPATNERDTSSLIELQARLTYMFYQMNLDSIGNDLENLQLAAGVKNCSESGVFTNEYDNYLLSMLNLCRKWAEAQIKEKIMLPKFEENRKQRELLLSCMNNLVPVLQKQREHQHLVSMVVHLWNKDCNVKSELLVEIQQEHESVVARVNSLQEVERKYKSFFDSGDYKNLTLVEKLKKLSNKFCPAGESKCLKDIIDLKENELHSTSNNQRSYMLNGYKQLVDIEKCVIELKQNVHSNFVLLSDVEEGYNECVCQLHQKKEENMEIMDSLLEDPLQGKMRLLWVQFLTDQKKLHNLREQIALEETVVSPETPMSFKTSLLTTSTPKKDGQS